MCNPLLQSNKSKSSKFFGCLSNNQTQIVYSTTLLSLAILTLSNLPKSSLSRDEYEEEEEDLLNSRNLIHLFILIVKLLAQTALFSSLLSLIGTITSQPILQFPLKLQALINLFVTSFCSVVLGTLYLSPTLLNSASHQLCLFAIQSDSTSSPPRVPTDYSISSLTLSMSQSVNSFWTINVSGENCHEGAASIIFPSLILITLCNLIHLHLVYVLFALQPPSSEVHPLLPLHHPSPLLLKNYPPFPLPSFNSLHQKNEKTLIVL